MKRRFFSSLIYLCVFIVCLALSGCATMGAAGAGFGQLLTTVVMLPFHVLGKVADIVGKLPMPPPWVFLFFLI